MANTTDIGGCSGTGGGSEEVGGEGGGVGGGCEEAGGNCGSQILISLCTMGI